MSRLWREALPFLALVLVAGLLVLLVAAVPAPEVGPPPGDACPSCKGPIYQVSYGLLASGPVSMGPAISVQGRSFQLLSDDGDLFYGGG